jgi:NAD+-dependent secondary alcohol dehydrogenase Adh1
MRAVRLYQYHQDPVVEEVPEPTIAGPLDVIVMPHNPTPTCGLCSACRAGNDMHCEQSSFPGLS